MEKTNNAEILVAAHKSMMIEELVDLMKAATIIAKELNAIRIYHSINDGKISVQFYENLPFDDDEIKRRTITFSDGRKMDELYTNFHDVEFSCFAPMEE